MNALIKTENLEFSYEQEEIKKTILKGINIEITTGDFVAVLGHNGSGKSTLAKHFNAILLPCGGTVYVDGIDTKEEKRLFEIRRSAGMVFQNPDNQLVATVVEEDVAFAPENLGVPTKEIRKRVDEALEAVGMTEYALHAPHQLSGGQKQRVAIAGIIAMKPKCIILDEPTAMLDPSGRKEVLDVIKRLNRQEGITIVLITHYMNEAAMADRLIVMNEGSILIEGTPYEVFMNAGLLKSVGLDVPQSTQMMFSLRENGFKVPLAVITSDECAEEIAKLLEQKT